MSKRTEAQGVTIDGPYSKDLDDAIWLESHKDGYLIQVSIADVASAVESGSEIDQQACKRAFTRYYENSNDPMIPHQLSEDACSLLAGKSRDTVTVSITLTGNLDVADVAIHPTYLVSQCQFSHDSAAQAIQTGESPHSVMLQQCSALARRLFERRKNSGALAFYDPRNRWGTSEEGRLQRLPDGDAHIAHLIIQEFMILTNTMVACYFAERQTPVPFRNHTANALAPERDEVLADIERTLGNSMMFSVATLQDKLRLILNRATYDPVLTGHYGLNLPAYLHFTSPIRRYADLVVHRVLHTTLKGDPSPYTQIQLKALTDHITSVENGIKDARAESRRKKQWGAIINGQAERLGRGDFSRVIHTAVTQRRMNWRLEKEIIRRIKAGELNIRDMFRLLIEARNAGPLWTRIQRELLAYLAEQLTVATEIFKAAQDALNWPAPAYSTKAIGHEMYEVNVATARITIDGETYESPQCRAIEKHVAEQRAAVMLLVQVLSHTNDTVIHIIELKHKRELEYLAVQQDKLADTVSSGGLRARGNPKGKLQELCQKNGWGLPLYTEATQDGPSHAPAFSLVASVTVDGEPFYSSKMTGATKKDAEQFAAQDLIRRLPKKETKKQLEQILGSSLQTENGSREKNDKRDTRQQSPPAFKDAIHVPLTPKGHDFISALNLLWQRTERQKRRMRKKPRYSFFSGVTEGGSPIRCVVTFYDFDNNQFQETKEGADKKETQQAAAETALKIIAGREGMSLIKS